MASHPPAQTARQRAAKRHPVEPAAADAARPDGASREDMIRMTAYSYFERRGFEYGHALEDWLRAEAEVDARLAAARDAH